MSILVCLSLYSVYKQLYQLFTVHYLLLAACARVCVCVCVCVGRYGCGLSQSKLYNHMCGLQHLTIYYLLFSSSETMLLIKVEDCSEAGQFT